MTDDIEDQITRGFESVAARFEERGKQISTLSNEMTALATNLGHLTRSVDKLDKDITNLNLHGLRVEMDNCKKDILEIKESQKYNSRYITTSLVTAVLSLLAFIFQLVWKGIK